MNFFGSDRAAAKELVFECWVVFGQFVSEESRSTVGIQRVDKVAEPMAQRHVKSISE